MMTQELDLEGGIADSASMAEVCNQISDKYWANLVAAEQWEMNAGGKLAIKAAQESFKLLAFVVGHLGVMAERLNDQYSAQLVSTKAEDQK